MDKYIDSFYKDKCNIHIKRENSTGNLTIINKAYLIWQAKNEEIRPSVRGYVTYIFEVCRIKLTKSTKIFSFSLF